MSRSALKAIQAAAGNAGEAVYVDDVFSTFLYDGTGSAQTITNGIDLAGEGGMIWTKQRSPNARNHFLGDSERNNFRNYLYPNLTNAESGLSGAGYDISSVSSTGYSLGADNYTFNNESGSEQVSWTFRKQPGFFDVVTYTGNGSAPRTINHNLGSVPGMIIIKRTDATANWSVYHRGSPVNASGKTYNLKLNVSNPAGDSDFWPSTPTSTDFVVGDTDTAINASGGTYVAYLFAHDAQDFGTDSDESIIKCGSYTGTGSAGNSINLGFEPQWMLLRKTTATDHWRIIDVMRGWDADGTQQNLNPNESYAENSTSTALRPTSNGFEATGSNMNNSGETYIYVAIRRPHKPAEEFAATDLFAVDNGDGSSVPRVSSGFPVDFGLDRGTTFADDMRAASRLTGREYINTTGTGARILNNNYGFDYMSGYYDFAGASNDYSWMFRRAPGFFDVVAYEGNQQARGINHNLTVAPEMIWTKCRSHSFAWSCWHKDLGEDFSGTYNELQLNDYTAEQTGNSFYDAQSPTATQYYLNAGTASAANRSGRDYIAYLFATVDGISKVGSYTGNGSSVDVDCGFTNGARFILIKASSHEGNWLLFDSARGIVAGNDPYLRLNSDTQQQGANDLIDPLSSGFTVNHDGVNNYDGPNRSGYTYIFLAIA